MNWGYYRMPDGTLDVIWALLDRHSSKPLDRLIYGISIVSAITSLHSIKSTVIADSVYELAILFSTGSE